MVLLYKHMKNIMILKSIKKKVDTMERLTKLANQILT